MAQAASPLVYEMLARLAVLGVPGNGRLKSALWVASGEPDLAAFDAAIDAAAKLGWVVVDGAYVELTPLGLFAAQHGVSGSPGTYASARNASPQSSQHPHSSHAA